LKGNKYSTSSKQRSNNISREKTEKGRNLTKDMITCEIKIMNSLK